MRTFFIVFLPGIGVFLAGLLIGLAVLYVAYALVKHYLIPAAKIKRAQLEDQAALIKYARQVQPYLSKLVLTEGTMLELTNEERETLFQLRNPETPTLKEITK